jgi:type IV pilus assembly protein PilB
LEDPVEYKLEGVVQTPIDHGVDFSFAKGLRAILRQDPDIVMVGEIRDQETAETAMQAALTGHLVLSTLHTNDASGAIPRLINMGLKPFVVGPALSCVMAQRLVRKICPDCKKEVPVIKTLEEEMKKSLIGVPPEYIVGFDPTKIKVFKGEGCEKCGHTGYVGRFGIFEVLPSTNEIQELVTTKASGNKIYEVAAKLGMITMKQDGVVKVLRGETTMDEVIRVTTE